MKSYENKPFSGGIAMMEGNKTKWRTHFLPPHTKQFSRVQMILKGMGAQVEAMGKEGGDILDEWESAVKA
jgi:hypothetical protein